jgi:anti-anti-sigma factor
MLTTSHPNVTVSRGLSLYTSFRWPGVARVAVAGDLEHGTVAVLGDHLHAIISDYHPATIEVDLTDVTFLGCAGVSMLVQARNVAEQNSCSLRLSQPQPIVRRVLHLTGLLEGFTASPAQTAAG